MVDNAKNVSAFGHGMHSEYDEGSLFLPDVDPEDAVGLAGSTGDWGSEIGSYDDLDDQSFYGLEGADWAAGRYPYADAPDVFGYGPTHDLYSSNENEED